MDRTDSVENLKAQLPLMPGATASVTVYVHGASDFLMPAVTNGLAGLHQGDDLSSLPSLSGSLRSISTSMSAWLHKSRS